MINKEFYIDYLSQQTKADGRPYETALSDFCDYLLDLFSVKAFDGTLDGFKTGSSSAFRQNQSLAFWLWLG